MIETGRLLQQRYRIDKQIGQGGMGAVYVATDERFGSRVAIKETLFMDDNYRKAIEREARLLNSLKHSALPRVSDHFLEENGQFLVMEYISGEDLGHVMDSGHQPFPVEQVLIWADQLLDALDFLHNQVNPVIHRDIKPQNLKVTPKGQIILLDFGLAKGNPTDAGHQTAAKSIFGYSRNYASLEQIQGTGTDPRSDLYSLAATLYHLLTRRPPEDALTRAMAVLSHQPDPLISASLLVPDIPRGLSAVLNNALALNAGGRPPSAAEMRVMLREHEKYAHLAPAAAVTAAPIGGEIFSQQTRLMPGSTVAGARQTDVRTEVMPGQLSQLTAVKSQPADTNPKPKRRFGFAAAAFGALLLCGTVLGGAYFYNPGFFHGETTTSEPPVVAPPVEELNAEADAANSNTAAAVAEQAQTQTETAPTATTNSTTGSKTTEPARSARSQASNPAAQTRPDMVIVDGDTVYSGNTKITNGQIESPNTPNGIAPPPPGFGVAPVIPQPDMRHMTPEQKRRLMRALRRNGIIVKPSPQP